MSTRKMLVRTLARVSGAFSLLPMLWGYHAQAQTSDCTAITRVPTVITTPGVYCFNRNLSTDIASGNAIEIQADNVTIDMNGYKLGGRAGGPATLAKGFYAYQHSNITIRNGTVAGFYYGVHLDDVAPYVLSQGHRVENVLADLNTTEGFRLAGRGMRVWNNRVSQTGSAAASVFGIVISGSGANVTDNQVLSTAAKKYSCGILLDGADDAVLLGNRIMDTKGVGTAIKIRDSVNVSVLDNSISGANKGIVFVGLSAGKYQGNLTHNITTAAFVGGTAVGVND